MNARTPEPITPESLARHYSRFRVSDRVLLTGHSHQAWPDVAFAAQQRAWLDAARYVDDKWDRAFEIADKVRAGYRRLLDDAHGHIALGQNTHELVTRFLSALPLKERPRLVTTDGEFHTIRRQLDRLRSEGIDVAKVPVGGDVSVAEAITESVDDRTAAVLVSSVLFRDARIVDGMDAMARACARVGAEMLVDAYHAVNVVPFSVSKMELDGAFVVGGGYKYCQLGEGNAFLRFPEHCTLRPVLTGWFAEFGALARRPEAGETGYGAGHLRFAGSTYDPVSHYRAASVFGFFRDNRLGVGRLRERNQAQIRRLAVGIDNLDLDPAVLTRDRSLPLRRRGGFLALETPHAREISVALRRRRVFTDYRGTVLRLGPAPYVTNPQLDEAVGALGAAVEGIRRACV